MKSVYAKKFFIKSICKESLTKHKPWYCPEIKTLSQDIDPDWQKQKPNKKNKDTQIQFNSILYHFKKKKIQTTLFADFFFPFSVMCFIFG